MLFGINGESGLRGVNALSVENAQIGKCLLHERDPLLALDQEHFAASEPPFHVLHGEGEFLAS